MNREVNVTKRVKTPQGHRVDPKPHRVLAEQVPRIGRLENIDAINLDVYVLIRGYLDAHRDEIDVADLDVAAFICVTPVEALTHAAVLRRPRHPHRRKSRKVCLRSDGPGGPTSLKVLKADMRLLSLGQS
jgi:tetracycline repressor-like protein